LPVLKIIFDRFEKMTGLSRERIIDRLPFLGLDIEGLEEESIRIEYNPNRPDFSTDYGIARALKGLVGSRVGLPRYTVRKGHMVVTADRNLAHIRPFIACAVARNLALDDETIRQLISMQEDLHNGIGRKRRKVAIGLHNLDVISGPITYRGVERSFSFVPLGTTRNMAIGEILEGTEQGRLYGHILSKAPLYPMLYDSEGTVLSFPPIINGNKTKVDTSTRNLFIDITSTDERLGEDALAVICSALSDAGAQLESTRVRFADRSKVTPDLAPRRMRFDRALAAETTGLKLSPAEMKSCLRRSRLEVGPNGYALIPRYRSDVLHPIDLSEEVAIGYGLDRIRPEYPPSSGSGSFDGLEVALDQVCESLARAGFTETMNFDLVDEASLYGKFTRRSDDKIEVENPRTIEHYLLRDALLPSLMGVLSRNVKAEYPQRIFEVGRTYGRQESQIVEAHRLACLVAHSSSSFSEAKSYLEAVLKEHATKELVTRAADHWAFAKGRCAEVLVGGRGVGYLGEVIPAAVAAFGLDVPVGGFEIDVTAFR
jgi:phenylalanyl-tRNA synthetase beta chain